MRALKILKPLKYDLDGSLNIKINEAIKELEELEIRLKDAESYFDGVNTVKRRSCESCNHYDRHSKICYEPKINKDNSSSYFCVEKDFCCNKWESK